MKREKLKRMSEKEDWKARRECLSSRSKKSLNGLKNCLSAVLLAGEERKVGERNGEHKEPLWVSVAVCIVVIVVVCIVVSMAVGVAAWAFQRSLE